MFGPGRNWRYINNMLENGHESRRYWSDFSDYVRHNFKEFLEDVLEDAIVEAFGIPVDATVYLDSNFGFARPRYAAWGELGPAEYESQSLSYIRVRIRTERSGTFSMESVAPNEEIFFHPRYMVDYVLTVVGYARQHVQAGNSQPYVRELSATRVNVPDFLRFTERYSGTPLKENKRAKELLLSHCTDEQVEEYENHKTITVVGGSTGAVYRIRAARQINVDVMGNNGHVKHKLCTVPDPETNPLDLPIEDQLLAQKELIELNEPEFLRIAIKW